MLSNEQLERYSRHIILKEVGAKGQKKLLNAKVLIIGAGGLGAPAAMYLAAAGVGTIGIADADEVDLSNLQRQIIHSTQDVGKAKVQSAKETMEAINPDVKVITYRTFVDSESIMDLIKDYDFIIDGTDNFPAKFLINDACVMAKKPFSHAEQAPDHGKGHADPAVQVHVGAGIVPEHDPQQLVIEKVHGVFHGGGREAAVKGQAEEAPGQVGGQVQHRQHGQTVHRAQGQQEKALAHLMPGAGGGGKRLLQQVSQKAIQTKQPQPIHSRTPLRSHFVPGAGL